MQRLTKHKQKIKQTIEYLVNKFRYVLDYNVDHLRIVNNDVYVFEKAQFNCKTNVYRADIVIMMEDDFASDIFHSHHHDVPRRLKIVIRNLTESNGLETFQIIAHRLQLVNFGSKREIVLEFNANELCDVDVDLDVGGRMYKFPQE